MSGHLEFFLRTSLPVRLRLFFSCLEFGRVNALVCVCTHTHTHIHPSKLCGGIQALWTKVKFPVLCGIPDTISCWFLYTFSFIPQHCLKIRNCPWAAGANAVAQQVRQLMMPSAEFKSWDGASGWRIDWGRIINSQTFSRGKIKHKEVKMTV